MTETPAKPLRNLTRSELRQINRVAWDEAERRRMVFYQRLRLKMIARARRTPAAPMQDVAANV